jgi:hypothetical protein
MTRTSCEVRMKQLYLPKMPACGEPVANHRERFAPNDAATR